MLVAFRFIRYADDISVFTETEEKATETLHVLEDFLLTALKLSLKPAKTNITVALQLKLAELDIPVVLAPPTGAPLAVLNPIRSTKSHLRYRQALRRDDPDIVSTGLGMLAAKVGNQAAVLRYFAKYRKKMKSELGWRLTDTADKITAIAEKILEVEPFAASARTVAMGLEGHAAAIYWHQILSIINHDSLVRSLPNRHTGERRYPELSVKTGFRVKHGMTKKGKIDFLRGRQP